MSGRPAIRRWLILLVVTGPLTLLLWVFLHPVSAPLFEIGGGHWEWSFDVVAFRPIWKTAGLTSLPGWLAAEAVFALTIGASAACFWPLSTDRR